MYMIGARGKKVPLWNWATKFFTINNQVVNVFCNGQVGQCIKSFIIVPENFYYVMLLN